MVIEFFMELKLNQVISLNKIIYKIIGIDYYSMHNILENVKQWISYTLVDSNGKKTWISYGHAGKYFVQWCEIKKNEYSKLATGSLNPVFSGIAKIKFEGNPGYSTPYAEIIWTDVKNEQFDCVNVERFLEKNQNDLIIKESYYLSGKILKDFKP